MIYFELSPRTCRKTQAVFYKSREQLEEFLKYIPDKKVLMIGGVPHKVITTTRDFRFFPEKTRREKIQGCTFDEVAILPGVTLGPYAAVDVYHRTILTGGIVFGESEKTSIANIMQRALRDVF